ncbi:hypothetical protein C1637_00260 [Chryseobacterium lactis]|uniref:DUF4468 domain-containing protein n=1 Tax=Chryseobacterium lactis TaxID=1241981 RepID=A0A3G6RQE6_CHRLC|nr:hypothetical protein [Chryseobacterium lactis]AZA81052.1 hypothetical protein EG342_03645 [Chryseobacterium lactis]AZB06053.1 hypothetical protein EG341_19770 [Chryseobacterium lactis]PNW14903.1 hypothetical protein C1637_00260 [Chryseobacterium lactis]
MKKLFLLLLMAVATTTFAQNQINLQSGNFDFLKDQSVVNVQLKLENATYQEKNLTEAQYLEGRKGEIMLKKGEAVWQNWTSQWEKFKTSEYLEYFLKGINGKSKKVVFNNDTKAKYTLIIDSKWIYAGWYGGMIGSQEAKLTADLTFVETDNPEKVVMKLKADKIGGKQMNKEFSWEYGRIAAAYEVTGKKLGKEIKDALK